MSVSVLKGVPKIILGDQSPWFRGLLRLAVVTELIKSKKIEQGATVTYFLHNTDTPWINTGCSYPRIKTSSKIREEYWSVGGGALVPMNHDVAQTLKSPPPFWYVIGGSGGETIWSEEEVIVTMLKNVVKGLNEWYQKLGDWSGGFVFREIPLPSVSGLLAWVKEIVNILVDVQQMEIKITTTAEFFGREENQKLVRSLLSLKEKDQFWAIDPTIKKRRELSDFENENIIIVPRARKLVEILTKVMGYTLCATHLSYVDHSYYMSVKFGFDEQDLKCLRESMAEEYMRRKKRRGQQVTNLSFVELPGPDDVLPDVLSVISLGYKVWGSIEGVEEKVVISRR